MPAYFDDLQGNKKRCFDFLWGHRLKGAGHLWGPDVLIIAVRSGIIAPSGRRGRWGALDILKRFLLHSLRVSFGLFLFPNLEELCVLFSVRRPFPSLVECIPWNILLQGHMTQSWKPLFSGVLLPMFSFFLLKHKPNQLFLFLVWGCGESHSRDPLANRSEGASESCPLAALPWEEGCWDGILVPWKEENSIQAVMRKQPMLVLMPVCSSLLLPLPQADQNQVAMELLSAELLIFSPWVLSVWSKFRGESSGLWEIGSWCCSLSGKTDSRRILYKSGDLGSSLSFTTKCCLLFFRWPTYSELQFHQLQWEHYTVWATRLLPSQTLGNSKCQQIGHREEEYNNFDETARGENKTTGWKLWGRFWLHIKKDFQLSTEWKGMLDHTWSLDWAWVDI